MDLQSDRRDRCNRFESLEHPGCRHRRCRRSWDLPCSEGLSHPGISITRTNSMETLKSNMAEQVARAASIFQQQRTGHLPDSVTVLLSDQTLVVTLHGALSPAEKDFAKSACGAAQVQEFHRQLFINTAETLRQEIGRITGVEVCDANAEVETSTGTVIHVFTTGTMVQVFQLAGSVPAETWSSKRSNDDV